MAKSKNKPPVPITDQLRRARVEVLDKSVRDVAKILGTSPIHLSDIETGKRSPSEDLLVRIAGVYRIPIAELRSGFSRPESIVLEVASESSTAAEKVPEFLRAARGWSAEQWEAVIKQAKKLNAEKES